jgi:hypothetical protein
MKKLQILSFLLLIIYYQSNAQHVLTLKTYGKMGSTVMLWSIFPDSNMVTWPEVKANAWTWNGEPGIERSLLYFNLGAIPANSVIQSAKLSLYGWEGDNDYNYGSNECLIQRVTSLWNPLTVNWNTQPNSDTVHEAILPRSTGLYEDYLNTDVTALIQDLYNNQDTYKGLIFKLDTEYLQYGYIAYYNRMLFRSAHQPDSAKFPALTINYSLKDSIEPSSDKYFSISPNPSGANFVITRNSELNDASLVIYKASGDKIYIDSFSSGESRKEVHLNSVATGIYFINIIDGSNRYCKKLLIN